MIIAIPVVEKTIESSVNPSFGRSPYFLLYDVKKKNRIPWRVLDDGGNLFSSGSCRNGHSFRTGRSTDFHSVCQH